MLNKPNFTQSNNNEERYGMSNAVWDWTLKITEITLDITKAIMVIGGIIAANMADVIMGSIGVTILFGGYGTSFNNTPVWIIGTVMSMGASAIQIYLWSLLQRRNIGISQMFHWKKLPPDIKGFLVMAIGVWFIDTFIDVSPIALMVQTSQYKSLPILYNIMVWSVVVLVFILCGFSEILTSNMRAMLMTGNPSKQNGQPTYNNSRKPNTPPLFRQNQSESIGNKERDATERKSSSNVKNMNDIRSLMELNSDTREHKLRND